MEKIQKISKGLKIIFFLALFLIPLHNLIDWAFLKDSTPLEITSIYEDGSWQPVLRSENLNAFQKVAGCLVSFLPIVFYVLMYYYLYKLFTLYEKGHIFTVDNIRCIKKSAVMFFWSIVAGFFSYPLEVLILTMYNSVGERYSIVSFSRQDVTYLVFAAVIYIAGYIMDEGRKLKEEVDYLV